MHVPMACDDMVHLLCAPALYRWTLVVRPPSTQPSELSGQASQMVPWYLDMQVCELPRNINNLLHRHAKICFTYLVWGQQGLGQLS